MASPTKTFLQAVQTAAAAVLNGSEKAFNSVEIMPDADAIIPRLQARGVKFPACVLVDEGGDPHPHNRKIETLRFAAIIAVRNMRTPQGEWATEYLLDLCELFQAGDGTNPGQRLNFGTGTPIRSIAGPQNGPRGNLGIGEIITKVMYFDYKLQRS